MAYRCVKGGKECDGCRDCTPPCIYEECLGKDCVHNCPQIEENDEQN
ncbi:MAG: hypothetical protein FWE37_02545 [Spirochaetaceae bacterium]|nr:hypothetical protein [Spirochaetaceae bacterium]